MKDRTLESMFPVPNPTQIREESGTGKEKGKAPNEETPVTKSKEIKESECLLSSVKHLRQNVIKIKHKREYHQVDWKYHY